MIFDQKSNIVRRSPVSMAAIVSLWLQSGP